MIDSFKFSGSSHLASGSYDDETETLTVTFRDGRTYSGKVPQGVAAGLQGAASPGGYYSAQIRGRFPMVEV